ncbi:MAG: NAD(P)/FAD-dependent oxidoreductase [Anaerolineae bacterium]
MGDKRQRVVIVGAGFGGLWAARALARSPLEVLLVDRNNYHTFLPLLYQVAAAELEPEQIAHPTRSILQKWPNVHFAMADVTSLDLGQRSVKAADLKFAYDFLILATGSTSHYFGIAGAAEYAFPLKTLEQAITLRNHTLFCFERAVHEADPRRRRSMLTFAIVGGGPTGVEFAGALSELLYGPLAQDYPSLDPAEVRVVLLEAQESLLSGFPERLQDYTLRRLRKVGVQVHLGAMVSQVTQHRLELKDGAEIPTETVVWTAGVQGEPLAKRSGAPTARGRRVAVLPTLQLTEYPEVYAIGDLAYIEGEEPPLPMVAPVAIQQGTTAARNILRQIAGQSPQPFHYRDRGSMATIGRNAAVVSLGSRTFTGFVAWVIWLGVHLFSLIGFRNRIFVLINWAWDYFHERAVRLILPTQGTSGPGTNRPSNSTH